MAEKHDARREIQEARERLSDIAVELSRRTSGEWMAERAKETAMRKSVEYKDRVSGSPLALGIIGGISGALIGAAFGRRAEHKRYAYGYDRRREPGYFYEEEPLSTGYPYRERRQPEVWSGGVSGENQEFRGEGFKERAGEKVEGFKERAGEKAESLKERAGEKVEEVKLRADELKERAGEKYEGIKERAGEKLEHVKEKLPSRDEVSTSARNVLHERPLAVAFGAAAVGFGLAMLVPFSEGEQRMMSPLRRRIRQQLGQAGGQLESNISGEQPQQQWEYEPPAISPAPAAGDSFRAGEGGFRMSGDLADQGPGPLGAGPIVEQREEEQQISGGMSTTGAPPVGRGGYGAPGPGSDDKP